MIDKILLKAAKLFDQAKNPGCCFYISAATREFGGFASAGYQEPANLYFTELFDTNPIDVNSEDANRFGCHYMAADDEPKFSEEISERRVLALLLTREIWLDENKPKGRKS